MIFLFAYVDNIEDNSLKKMQADQQPITIVYLKVICTVLDECFCETIFSLN